MLRFVPNRRRRARASLRFAFTPLAECFGSLRVSPPPEARACAGRVAPYASVRCRCKLRDHERDAYAAQLAALRAWPCANADADRWGLLACCLQVRSPLPSARRPRRSAAPEPAAAQRDTWPPSATQRVATVGAFCAACRDGNHPALACQPAWLLCCIWPRLWLHVVAP